MELIAMINVLNKSHEVGLKLYPDKCIFKKPQVYGHLVTTVGLKPDPGTITAIVNKPIPKSKTQLQSFIALCNYLTSYVPHLTNVLFPLRALTAKSIEFQWKRLHT